MLSLVNSQPANALTIVANKEKKIKVHLDLIFIHYRQAKHITFLPGLTSGAASRYAEQV
jgi:hypothetical protein